MSATKLKILKGYDFHCHFRRPVVKTAVELTAECFCGAVAMGNTDPPIAIADDALLYEREIRKALPFGYAFQPIMTIMLTKMATPQVVIDAALCGIEVVKYIPEGVSVNSKESVALEKLSDYFPVLEAAQKNTPLCACIEGLLLPRDQETGPYREPRLQESKGNY